jgi:hypothetical protein
VKDRRAPDTIDPAPILPSLDDTAIPLSAEGARAFSAESVS